MRRHTPRGAAGLLAAAAAAPCGAASPPTDDPVAALYGAAYPWASAMVNWTNVRSVADYGGDFAKAQDAVVAGGGGVVYFPAGSYTFPDNIVLQPNVVIRGEPTAALAKAGKSPGKLAPKTVFKCPDKKHVGIFNNDAKGGNIGIVNVELSGCAVMLWPNLQPEPVSFKDYWYHATSVAGMGSNKLVLGCKVHDVSLGNPDPTIGAQVAAGNEWPWRFSTAIAVYSDSNALIANNLLPKASQSSKTSVAGFSGVPYPYDNRYGIDVNQVLLGGVEGQTSGGPCKATPANSPFYFRRGLTIRDNYVYQNGRVGISWSGGDDGKTQGSGTQVVANHVEVAKGTTLYSVTGDKKAGNSATNENRGYNQVGYGSNVTGNSGRINGQKIAGGPYMSVDGEGVLHQCSAGTDAYRSVWHANDLTGGERGYMMFYSLSRIIDNIVTDNKAVGSIGTQNNPAPGGNCPAPCEVKGNTCSGNTPKCQGF